MKKYHFFGILSIGMLLTACGASQTVSVVKGIDHSASSPTVVVKKVEIPANLPANVTAICRDGSYSTATTYACSGNGGIQTAISHYFSE